MFEIHQQSFGKGILKFICTPHSLLKHIILYFIGAIEVRYS